MIICGIAEKNLQTMIEKEENNYPNEIKGEVSDVLSMEVRALKNKQLDKFYEGFQVFTFI